MAQNLVTKHIIETVVNPTLDKAKRDKLNSDLSKIFADAANIDFDTKDTRESLMGLAKAFQAIFDSIGDKSIDFEKMIKLPAPEMFAKLGEVAAKQFWSAWDTVAGGVGDRAAQEIMREQLQQLEKQRADLLKRQKTLPKKRDEYEKLSTVVDDLPYMDENEFNAFAKEELQKIGKNIDKIALDMQQALVDALDDLSEIKLDDPKYDAALEDTLKKARDVFRMSRTLEKHPELVKDKTILDDYDFSYLQETYADELAVHTIRLSGLMKQVEIEIDTITSQLQEVDSQLVHIKSSGVDIVDNASAKSGLKTLKEIEDVYKRIRVAQGERIDDRQVKHIQSALDFDPKKSSEGIKTLYTQYKEASASGDWVEEYRALLRYVRLYESYMTTSNKTHRNKITKRGNEFTPLYEQLKPMADDARNMLQNILNMGEGKPLVGMGGSENGGATQEDIANAKMIREEAEAKARAEKEILEATRQKREEEEKLIKIEEQKKKAYEDAAEASRKAAEEAEKERLAKEESIKHSKLYTDLQSELKNAFAQQIDVMNGRSDAKESMRLVGSSGVLSTVDGADYKVDVATMVNQLIASLNDSIIMSLHDHPNAVDAFTPDDIDSFARLYYDQGAKINGIIANGVVKTIDFSGISKDIAIKIGQSFSENLSAVAEHSGVFSYDQGNIVPIPKVDALAKSNPEKYQEIMDGIIESVNASLDEAFKQNGLESTVKTFSAKQLPDLIQYLLDVQKSGEGAIAPVDKLKKLIVSLKPNQTFEWNNYADILKRFEDGSIDGVEAINKINLLLNGEQSSSQSSLVQKYDQASEAVKRLINDLVSANQQMQTLDDRTTAIQMDGFDKWNPTDEHKKIIVNTLNEYQRVMEKLSNFSIETDDDKKKLIELKEEALKLAKTLQMAYRSDSNPDSYIKEYGISREQARVFMDINNVSAQLHNDIRKALNDAFDSAFKQISVADGGFARAILDDVDGLDKLATKTVPQVNVEDELKSTIALLEKEKLTYEDILSLVKEYNNETRMKDLAKAGDWDEYDKIFAHHADIARKLVPVNMMGIGSDSPDKWLATVGMSADTAAQRLKELYDRLHQIESVDDELDIDFDEDDDLKRENGVLEDRLELLREIAEQYGINITQKQRDRYEELNQKDMDSGLTPKEDERYWELGEQIDDADRALEEFGETYDRIIVKLENGKKIEIFPDDKGLRSLAKIDEEYGESYNGVGIEDVVFERVEQDAVDAKKVVDELNNSIEETTTLTQGNQQLDHTGDASSADVEAAQAEAERQKLEKERIEAEKLKLQQENDAKLQAEIDEKIKLQSELNIANQQIEDLTNDFFRQQQISQDLREQLSQEQDRDGKSSVSVDAEELKNVLSSITYNVKVTQDEDGTQDKVAIDEASLATTLNKVFANIINPQTQKSDSEQKQAPWGLESTLQTIKGTLDNIHTNASSTTTTETPVIDTIAGTALDSRLVEIKEVLSSIDNKIVKGGAIAAKVAAKSDHAEPKEAKQIHTKRVADIKSITKDYERLGKLRAKFEKDGNLETKAALKNLAVEVETKRKSLDLTTDEVLALREKSKLAYEAEQRLIEAAKAQRAIDNQNKAAAQTAKQQAKDAEASWKKQVKDAQRATGINAATTAANAGDQTVLRAIGTEGVSKDVENKAKELSFQIKALRTLRDEIDKKGNQASAEDRDNLSKQIAKVKELKTEVDGYLKIHEKYSGEGVTDIKVDTSSFGSVGTDQYWNSITTAIKNASTGRVTIKGMNADTGELTGTTKIAANTFAQWSAVVDPLTGRLSMLRTGIKKTETMIEQITRKTKEIFTYFSGSSIIFKAFNELKKGVQYVRDIDLALTELKKVTDATEETYRKFLDTASKTAAKVGSTIKDVVSSTADWARLGYSMEEAAKFAETTQILMNVSEFTDVSKATDTLISAVQAFGYTAETSMEVVDLLNTIGNNYAISTADLAQSLTKSSASLVAAGGDLAEAAALTATANKIIQDADSVGTALKTTSLRLRGTSVKVLEEEGLDSDGAVESTSKLRSQVLALSGVDILTDTGAYKSTYQILLEIAKVWDKITDDKARAGLLELLAGKRNSSVIAALLQNPQDLEDAYKDAMNASGSALKENEKYLDSIQGKIDQFNNSLQTMWSNALDSDMVKGIVEIGTWLIKVIDKVSLLNSALIALATISMIKNKQGPVAFLQGISDMITGAASKVKGYTTSVMSMVAANTAVAQSAELTTVGSLKNAMAVAKVDVANKNAILSSLGLASADKAQAISRDTLTASTISTMVAEGQLTQAQANTITSLLGISVASNEVNAARMNELLMTTSLTSAQRGQIITQLGLSGSLKKLSADEVMNALTSAGMAKADAEAIMAKLGLTVANKGLAASFMTLWTAMWPVLALMAGVAVIWGIVKAFDAVIVTTEELGEELSDLKSELSDIESDIDSLNSDLEATQERIAELTAMPSLSFIEKEELEDLKATTAELERQIKLKKMLAESKEDALVLKAEEYIDKVWHSNKMNKSYYYDSKNKQIREDKGWKGFWNKGDDTKDLLDKAMSDYEKQSAARESAKTLLLNSDKLSEYEKYVNYTKTINGSSYNTPTIMSEEQFNEKIASDKNFHYTLTEDLLRDWIDSYDTKMANLSESINMVFSDENFSDLEYGMSDDIDTFLDEMYAHQLKWKQSQGEYVKSEAISSMFDATSTKEMQELGKSIREIADDDSLTDAKKNEQILGKVGEIDKTSEAYKRLAIAMDTVGVTAQDIADYFVIETGAFDSSTVEGITAQYQKGIDALSKYKGAATDVIAEITRDDGTLEGITWESMFDDSGEVISTRIAQVMKGADETARNEFARIAKAVNDGKMEVEDAIKSFGLSGTLAGFKLVEQSITELNTDVFKNLGDDISGLIDTFEELGSVLESVSSSMDLVSQAEAEQAYSGSVSLETALKLMQTTDDWNKVLTITEGSISVNEDATENLVKDQLNLVVANLKTSLSTVSAQIAQNNMATSSDNLGKTIEESTTESVRQLAANMEYLGSLVSDFVSMNWRGMNDRAQAAKAASLESTKVAETPKSTVDLGEQQANLVAQLQMMGITATIDENGNVTYDGEVDWEKLMSGYSSEGASGGNGTIEEVENDLFQREMDYWGNRIEANQAKSDQIQNEIDLLESQGIRAGQEYYQELIALEQERKTLLEAQRDEAIKYLNTQEEGSEEWWNAAQIVNDLEGEIDDATAAIQDFSDAQAQIKWDTLEEITSRFSDLHDEISDLRDILQREDMFDDDGNWTESGAAVLGTYVRDLEAYKNDLAMLQSEIADLQAHPYNEENAAYLKEAYSIDSEQEYNDLMTQWNEKQREYVMGAYDTADAIKDAYSQQVDAIEDAINEQIDAYNDYIDVVKEAYDAERELYEFKKDIQKQSKSIAETERKIASLSGSTNAADIAERRKLEAQLAEQRENINDSYYNHANEQRANALDDEAQAYEESMNRYVEGLRETLEEQANGLITFTETGAMVTNEFLNTVTATVIQNSGIILDKYEEVSPHMSDKLKQPFIDASNQLGEYGNDLSVLNEWTLDSGYFGKFQTTASGQMTTPFINGSAAVSTFQTSVTNEMNTIASNVRSNVTNITSSLGSVQSAYSGIITTANQAKSAIDAANAAAAAGAKYNGTAGTIQPGVSTTAQVDNRILSKYKVTADQVLALGYGPISLEEFEKLLREYKIKYSSRYKQVHNTAADERLMKKVIYGDYVSGPWAVGQYAKGTLGTKRDGFAITDESWIGEEITLAAGKNGQLQYLKKGSSVMPADISANLVEWGKIDPNMINVGAAPNINVINNAVNKPEFNFTFDALVKAENITEETLPAVKKLVAQELNRFTKELNYALKGKGAR